MTSTANTFSLVLISVASILSICRCEIILENTIKTNYGKWGSVERCPVGTYVGAFQLKTEQRKSFGDNTALNAVRLSCFHQGNTKSIKEITSSQGSRGKYGIKSHCPDGLFTGFQLRSEEDKGSFRDDSGATNLRMHCSSSHNLTQGDGLDLGEWTGEQKCFDRQAICAIQTQVEDEGSKDLTGLNNLKMICCDILNPATTCTPQDSWVDLIECDNLESESPFECKYIQTVGVGGSSISTSGESSGRNTLTSLGFDTSTIIRGLEVTFQNKLSQSSTTGFKWESTNTNTWTTQTTKTFGFVVPPHYKSRVSQIIGTCDQFVVHTTIIKKVDTKNESGGEKRLIKSIKT